MMAFYRIKKAFKDAFTLETSDLDYKKTAALIAFKLGRQSTLAEIKSD